MILINDMNQSIASNASTTTKDVEEVQNEQYQSTKPLRIVLTIATNVDPQRTYLFMASFRRWHPFSDENSNKIHRLYLFTKFSEEKYMSELQRLSDYFGVTLVDMDPIEQALDDEYLKLFNIKMKYIKINKRRFFILHHWLKSFPNVNDIDAIFLSDSNDVKFQV